ncbi:nitrate- and nitrite sensing domain-containing protein [Streptomyces sannanensis]|uniref:histidine kinase n=1 Tax=Streptomyces sannanensis TaxID=285536 RepID=A0ABP6SGH8_9ACTN
MRRSSAGPGPEQARGNFTPPPRTAVPPAVVPTATPPADGSSSKLSPRNWRVPAKLNAILLIPALVGIVMGGFQVNASVQTWSDAQDAEKTALLVRAASEYGQALLNERDLTAAPLLSGKSDSNAVSKAYETTNSAKSKFDQAVQEMPDTERLQRRLNLFRAEEPELDALRKAAYGKSMDPVKTEEGYTKVQHSLMAFSNELGLGTGNITSYGRTVYAIQLAKAATSLQRSIGTHLLIRPAEDKSVRAQQTVAFNSYNYLEQTALDEYVSGGTEADSDRLTEVMLAKAADDEKKLKAAGLNPPRDEKLSVFGGMAREIGKGRDPESLKADDITAETWMAAATAKFDGYSEIETELVDKAVKEAGDISAAAATDAYVNGGIVVVSMLAAFVMGGLMARHMSRSMRRLRTAAFGIAEQRLPMLVDQLSRTEPGRVDTRVEPIPITSHDEIGEVARAFDQVHREAVRLASEQALLRGNINAIFTNLSQRNQGLIEGQLSLITDLENNEADPEQLENLFRLDHLATRMRRNGENLLILAGQEPGRRWDQPVPLVDVLRAAASEVEQYERIELAGVPEAEIHGHTVTDLVHLLAELLENATTFSSPQTKVRVTATRLPDGRVMIEIHDKGIGLTSEDFADINHRLANPPTVDAAISQHMGLFVVGRLADRHGIRVQLRPSGEQAGTTSLVMLPDGITHGGGGDEGQESAFTVSSMIPEQQSFDPVQMRTAAELGFDDSRYEDPAAAAPETDPVGRSLMREERRATPAAQAGSVQPEDHDEQGYEEQGYEQQPYASEYAAEYRNGYPGGYPEQAYTEGPFPSLATSQQPFDGAYAPHTQQGEWQDQGAYEGAYAPVYGTEAESAPGADVIAPERVGFDHPESAPNTDHGLTDAGLPRRGSRQQFQPVDSDEERPVAAQPQPSDLQAARNDGNDSGDWRSANDERWQRAGKLRDPKAGGVTPSGLPRRVPKANLVEGTAEQTPQGGPQVSRAPEAVRGRLSNLRRGVQQGRNAGSDTNGTGFGPGSSYNQER